MCILFDVGGSNNVLQVIITEEGLHKAGMLVSYSYYQAEATLGEWPGSSICDFLIIQKYGTDFIDRMPIAGAWTDLE